MFVMLRTIMFRASCFVLVMSLIATIFKDVFSRGFAPSQFRSYTERQNRRTWTFFCDSSGFWTHDLIDQASEAQ